MNLFIFELDEKQLDYYILKNLRTRIGDYEKEVDNHPTLDRLTR
jgi:hypothetical protein